MHFNAVTLDDLMSLGKQLEIGCFICRLHIYLGGAGLLLPGATPLPDVAGLLRCPQCGAENAEPGYPLWVRPDSRPPRMGAAVPVCEQAPE